MATVTICSDFGVQESKVSRCFHCFPIYYYEVMGLDAMNLIFWMLSFKPAFYTPLSLSSRGTLAPLVSAIRVVSPAYLRFTGISPNSLDSSLCFLCQAFCMMYSAYKLNKQGDNIQLWHTFSWFGASLFHVQFYCFLTCIQIFQEAGKIVWYSHLLKNFPHFVVIYIVKGFSIINKAEVDVFLEFSCFFNEPMYVG